MDYEIAYKEVLDNAKKVLLDCTSDERNVVEYIFPELRESEEEKPNGGIVLEDFNEGDGFYKVNLAYLSKEQVEEIENMVKEWNHHPSELDDERIRKALIEYFNEQCDMSDWNGIYGYQVVGWLEKQGEQNPNPYSGASFVYNNHTWGMCARDGGVDILCDSKLIKHIEYPQYKTILENLSEQKQEWTEEDDNGLGDALWAVKQARTIAKNENEMGGLWYAERWLKSLKDRIQSRQNEEPQGKSATENKTKL